MLFFRAYIILSLSSEQFYSFWTELIFHISICRGLRPLSSVKLVSHIFINGIMWWYWTIFIWLSMQKLLRILEIIWPNKHRLLNKPSIALNIFIMLIWEFISSNLSTSNVIFCNSFLSQFLYQLTFVFLQKVYKLLTFLRFFLLLSWWLFLLIFNFFILNWLFAACFLKEIILLLSHCIENWLLFFPAMRNNFTSNWSSKIFKFLVSFVIRINRNLDNLRAEFESCFLFHMASTITVGWHLLALCHCYFSCI